MSDYLLPFLLVILFLAAFLRQDFVLTLGYLLVGAFLASRWWGRSALHAVTFSRSFPNRAFLGEQVPVRLEIQNKGRLPVIWLQVREDLPFELADASTFQKVITLPPHGQAQLEYNLHSRRRGFYPIGPLNLISSDVLGAGGRLLNIGQPDNLTVYPKIIPLSQVRLPSRYPLGTLRHTQPIFEDPSRPSGKRDYTAGDSLRRIDWKASATTGRLLVKQFDPSLALETAIFLGLNAGEYGIKDRFDDPELAIVVAASLAAWITSKRQAVGLYTNGADPLSPGNLALPSPVRRGRAHLMRILDTLARVEVAETIPLARLLQQELVNLSWGTTVILITSRAGDDIFEALFAARRASLDAVLLLVGQIPNYNEIRQRSETFGFPFHTIHKERDLDMWRH
jgi:uncharacterized protein (DUF58 family)